VLKPDGTPAAGAEVFLSTWAPPSVRGSTTADDNGRFVFTDFPDGVHRIVAKLGDLSSKQRWGGEVTKIGDSDLKIKLRTTSTLKVTVFDSNTGEPIPDAVVEVFSWFPDWKQSTNESGVATYSKLPREKWEVIAKAKGFALKAQEVVVSDPITEIGISLSDPGADLFGTVADAEGRPVSRAVVFVSTADEPNWRRAFHEQVRTDEHGNYRFASLPINKKLETRVSKEGFVDFKTSVMLGVETASQRQDFVIQQLPETTIEGVVTGSDNKPLAGVSVYAFEVFPEIKCETDEHGRYKLVGRFERNELVFEAKGLERQKFDLDLSKRNHEIDAQLSPGRRLSGRVVDSKGKPIAGVIVSATIIAKCHYMYHKQCQTDVDGRFEVDSLPQDSQVKFSKSGYSTVDRKKLPSESKLAAPIVLKPEGVIRGKVVDRKTGEPLQSFRAYYTWSSIKMPDDPKSTLSMASHQGDLFANSQGLFEFSGFKFGFPVEVTVEADGYRKCVVQRVVATARDEAKDETFEMEPIAPEALTTVAGRIVDFDGNGIAGVDVCLICSDKRSIRREGGMFRLRRDPNVYPFNWEMILGGQIVEDADVDQFLETTSDKDGKFSFTKVQSAKDMEVVWWSDTVVRFRRPGIEKLSAKEQQSITIKAQQSGTVKGSIDMKANRYASPTIKVGDVRYVGEIIDDGLTYVIKGVPPGKHEVLISGNPKPLKIPGREDDGAFTTEIIKRIPVTVRSGKIARADAAGDRM